MSGGLAEGRTVSELEIYESTDSVFTPAGVGIYGRGAHTATLLSNGTVLLAGGIDRDNDAKEERPLTSVESYDIATGLMSQLDDRMLPRSWHTATVLSDGSVLFVGGAGAEARIVATSEIFDPTQGEIRLAAATGIARSSHTANTLADGTILITGGLSNGAQFMFSAEIFTPPEIIEVPLFVDVVVEPTPVIPSVAPPPPPIPASAP